MGNGSVDILEGVGHIAFELVMLGNKVIEPQIDSGILFLVVLWIKRHLLVHRLKVSQQLLFNRCNLCWLFVKLLEILNRGWNTLNQKRAHVLCEELSKIIAM